MTTKMKQQAIQLIINSLNGDYGWESAVETAAMLNEEGIQ